MRGYSNFSPFGESHSKNHFANYLPTSRASKGKQSKRQVRGNFQVGAVEVMSSYMRTICSWTCSVARLRWWSLQLSRRGHVYIQAEEIESIRRLGNARMMSDWHSSALSFGDCLSLDRKSTRLNSSHQII